ncbi:MAG: hypothetical protein EXQ87_11915 [Alphaproteobacteria bacterium]|nr:hypothetical protein [Alphaproteobacteria bacterium]
MTKRHPAAGIILPVILPLVAVLALLVVFVQYRTGAVLGEARARADKIETERAFQDAEAVLLYLLATQVLGPRNVEVVAGEVASGAAGARHDARLPIDARPLALDGRPYRHGPYRDGDVILAVQDTLGLINLRTTTTPELEVLLARLDVPKSQRDRLVPAFMNHRHGPDHGLGPPPIVTFSRHGTSVQPIPPSRQVFTPWDVRRIPGWATAFSSDAGWSAWSDITTAADLAGVNVNTAQPAALASLPGMTEEAVARIIALREVRDIHGTADLTAVTGVAFNPDDPVFAYFPGNYLRVRLIRPGATTMRESLVILTPQSLIAPWLYRYSLILPAPRPEAGATHRAATALPTGNIPPGGH